MAAKYDTIKTYQKALSADTAWALTLPAAAAVSGSQYKVAITAPQSRTVPVFFIFRASGSDEPTTAAAGASVLDGSLSPLMPPGFPAEVDIPSGMTTLVVESPQAGDVYVTIYERVL